MAHDERIGGIKKRVNAINPTLTKKKHMNKTRKKLPQKNAKKLKFILLSRVTINK